ncbi:hypothetical protein AB0K60_21355 [Thermopolyspora sp. NPDC052614]|uniref:hypothetical protein n=1 Tax=Thermopolyspora sp. NPDC052614 TaxID=3155682 RepID=UPI00343ECE2A
MLMVDSTARHTALGGFMRRKATTLLALLAFLAVGAPAHAAQQAQPRTIAAAVEGAQAPKFRECFDGRCTITVRKPVSFRISERFGFTRLTVSRHGLSVRVKAKGPGVSGGASITKGGVSVLNGISIRIVSISRSKATVRFAPVN